MPNQPIHEEPMHMTQDNLTQYVDTQYTANRVKPSITIHTFMAILTVMFLVALVFILGLDYFFNLPQLHSQSMFSSCLPAAKQAFCVSLQG